MSILIVEDDPKSAKKIEAVLSKGGYKTTRASSARQALRYLESGQDFELIISGIMMPGIGGLELLSKIKEHLEWRKLPVIMCSVRTDMATIKRTTKLGCKAYIVKPIKAEALIQKVRDALS